LDQEGAELVPISSVFLRVRDLLGSGGSSRGRGDRGSVGVTGQDTRDSTFSIKVGAELGNDFFLDVNFPVEVFSKSMVVGTGVGGLGLHRLWSFFEGCDGFTGVFEKRVDGLSATSGVLEVED
jgi:hypothetical protein